MLYAIVDIETTGGHPSAHGITEVAINIHDGSRVIQRYTTLLNPQQPIPIYITALTGIHEHMVADAPVFSSVAQKIYDLLEGKIFIAHNVNFDYSFLKHHLAHAGFELNCKKLCTVRMSRKLIPGQTSYSLGKLCHALDIPVYNRHRAGGDADATTILFEMLLAADSDNLISEMVKKTSKEQVLPPNLSKKDVLCLPNSPGVYYFKDRKGKIIYVGKAVDIKKRVVSHFSGHSSGRQRQDFLRNIHSIDCIPCGTELMALVMEATEIKRLWPESNSAMKRYEHKYGLFLFEDQNGFFRLAIDKHKNHIKPIQSFSNQLDGLNYLARIVERYELCPKLCHIHKSSGACYNFAIEKCAGACCGIEPVHDYNNRLMNALDEIKNTLPSFALIDIGRKYDEYSCLLVENGKFYGMGYLNTEDQRPNDLETLKEKLKPYPSNNYIVNLILTHAEKYPQKLHLFYSQGINLQQPA